ncbi:hypothetical protein GCM10022267_90840 [Lentzea roselyniae]|uniref:Secreted protein n=1 Tax=Lentzea roselyniae TaxID=531940 RepID=A0ABP7CKG3_9PSEU
MDIADESETPAPSPRWGTVLGVGALAVGAVVIGPQVVDAGDAQATASAKVKVTCSVSPVVKLSERLTENSDEKPFTATLQAGTAACDDTREDKAKIIGASYGEQAIGAKGNCAKFSLTKTELKVDWITLGGQGGKSTVTIDGQDGTEIEPGAVTIADGPLKGWQVAGEANDITPAIATALQAACKAEGITEAATSANIVFTPKPAI